MEVLRFDTHRFFVGTVRSDACLVVVHNFVEDIVQKRFEVSYLDMEIWGLVLERRLTAAGVVFHTADQNLVDCKAVF